MAHRNDKNDEIIYMDEIGDEIPESLASKSLEMTAGVRSGMIETDNTNNPRPTGPEINNHKLATNPPIFDYRGTDSGLLSSEPGISENPRTPFFSRSPLQPIPDVNIDGGHQYYYPSLVLIGSSLLLQIAVGIGLIWNSRYNIKDDAQMCKADRTNNWTVIGIFLVTIFNVFISSFGVVDQVSTVPIQT